MDSATDSTPFSFSMAPIEESRHGLIHQPSMLAPPTTKLFVPIPEVARQKLKYPIEQLQKAPASMVKELQTPWSHPKLWEDEMPQSMQGTLCWHLKQHRCHYVVRGSLRC